MTDAEIAGIMGWRGPGAYTEATLRKIRRIVEQVQADERATPPSPSTAPIAEDELRAAAAEVLKRWNTPLWRQEVGTAALMNRLRAALASRPAGEVELPPLPEPKYAADDLTDIYTADQLRAYGQECARAEYQCNVARIRHLTYERDKARADLRAALVALDAADIASILDGALADDILPYHSPEWVERARATIKQLRAACK